MNAPITPDPNQAPQIPPVAPATAAATVGMGVATKVIIGLIAVAVIGGGGYAIYHFIAKSSAPGSFEPVPQPTVPVVAEQSEPVAQSTTTPVANVVTQSRPDAVVGCPKLSGVNISRNAIEAITGERYELFDTSDEMTKKLDVPSSHVLSKDVPSLLCSWTGASSAHVDAKGIDIMILSCPGTDGPYPCDVLKAPKPDMTDTSLPQEYLDYVKDFWSTSLRLGAWSGYSILTKDISVNGDKITPHISAATNFDDRYLVAFWSSIPTGRDPQAVSKDLINYVYGQFKSS